MAKKDLVGLSGTPWHVGYLKKEEDDPRRDKRNCAYYNKGYCTHRFGKCIGSSHCDHYKCYRDEQIKQKKRDLGSQQIEVCQAVVPNVIQCGDTVDVYCFQTKRSYTFTVVEDAAKRPLIQQTSLGKKVKDTIACNQYTYRITKLTKRSRV